MLMTPVRVVETSETNGTGSLTLAGALDAGYRTFLSAFGSGLTPVYYSIFTTSAFEVGLGIYNGATNQLQRAAVLRSSNGDALVNFVGGTKTVLAWWPGGAPEHTFSATLSAADIRGHAEGMLRFTGTAAATMNLPALADLPIGWRCWVLNAGSADVTVDPSGAETVDGAATAVLVPGQRAMLVRGAGGWHLFRDGTDRVLRSGDQMSGNLTIGPQAAVNSQVTINGDLANARQAGIMLQRGGANRLLAWVNAAAETGGSTGSNVEVFTYRDSGVAELVLSIQRATRVVTFTEIPVLPGTNPTGANDAVRLGYITPYVSPDQTLTAGGALTLAHGLGVKPALVTAGLKCISAEHGYAVNDELIGPPYYDNTASIGLCGIVPDGTNLNVRYASSFSTLIIPHKSTGARAIVTPANWRAVFRAWR